MENATEVNVGEIVPDGDTGAILTRVAIRTAETVAVLHHGLNRVPTKAYVVESTQQPFACYTVFKDRDQIQLRFVRSDIGFSLDGGTALVRIF
jgi:hypothetical protein